MRPRPRILIFVVAYEAQTTLAAVLRRIPPAVWRMDVEVLVIDDASHDSTFETGVAASAAIRGKVTVLSNPENQGYGGNQKLGYAYAIRHGFDIVVLLHGDGQYAPESLPTLLAPLINGEADAVLGSRMLTAGAARRGGMPLYKFVGNKVLTTLQNALLGTALSEFHSGYRAYSVAALRELPFDFNSNVFHFDTEIIIQLVYGGFRILEVPIPTYYGDEICRVNGLRYAKDVLSATIRAKLTTLSIFFDRRFDLEPRGNQRYRAKLGYESSHTMALQRVPSGSTVLDIGCGGGIIARELQARACAVDGADLYAPPEPAVFRHFESWSHPAPLPYQTSNYDVVLLLDILEHLTEPERFLDALRESASGAVKRPRFLITTGNVAFGIVRLQLLFGGFNYGRRGILDLTHTRLYTFSSAAQLLRQCGFDVEEVEGIPAPFPLAFGDGAVGRWLLALNTGLIRVWRSFFSYQILLVARPRPTIDSLLDVSVAASARRLQHFHENAVSREVGVAAH